MKLTLSLDKELIEFAHQLARKSNDSISNMVASMFRNAAKASEYEGAKRPAVKALHGYFKKKPLPDKEEMKRRLLKKHSG